MASVLLYPTRLQLGMAINLDPRVPDLPRPKKTHPAPPRLCNRVSDRVFKLKRVLNGSGFIEKPESDSNYWKKKKKFDANRRFAEATPPPTLIRTRGCYGSETGRPALLPRHGSSDTDDLRFSPNLVDDGRREMPTELDSELEPEPGPNPSRRAWAWQSTRGFCDAWPWARAELRQADLWVHPWVWCQLQKKKKKKKEFGRGGLNGYPLKQTGWGNNGFFWGGSLNGSGRSAVGWNSTHTAPLPSLATIVHGRLACNSQVEYAHTRSQIFKSRRIIIFIKYFRTFRFFFRSNRKLLDVKLYIINNKIILLI